VPELQRRRSAQRRRPVGAGSPRTGGSYAGEGQDGFACVKSASDPSRRTTRSASAFTSAGPADRTRARSRKPTTIAMSFTPRPTNGPRSTSTASERCSWQMRRHNKAVRQPASDELGVHGTEPPLRGVTHAFWKRLFGLGRPNDEPTGRSSTGKRVRTCSWPGYPSASPSPFSSYVSHSSIPQRTLFAPPRVLRGHCGHLYPGTGQC